MLWIISGPSSVGKSTFIRSGQCFALTGLRPETSVLKPKNIPGLDARLLADADCFVHYNILRPVSLFAKREATKTTPSSEYRERSVRYHDDPWWNEFSARTRNRRAIVMVANRATISNRATARPNYKTDYWQELYRHLDLAEIYRAWCAELERQKIPFVFVDATGSTYPELDSSAAFAIIKRDP
jgi:hypothetical protein